MPEPLPDPTVHLLLAVQTEVHHAGVTTPLAPLDAALLAWLALEGPTPRTRLAALLWPEKPPEAARNSLRQRLFQLRRQVGVELVEAGATAALVDGVSHDLHDADTLLDGVAVEIAGEFGQWLEMQRSRRRARVRSALVELADMAEAAKDWDDALAHAGELLALDPLSEAAHRRVMRLHYLRGDRAAALLAFDRCERVLKDEVGARPSAETLALLSTLERAGADTALPAARLAPAALLRPPRLVGRTTEWSLIEERWRQAGVVLLDGEAGMGKSRLAGDFAQRDAGASIVVSARPGDAAIPYACVLRLVRAMRQRGVDAPEAVRRPLARLLPEFGEVSAGDDDEGAAARLDAALSTLCAGAAAVGVRLVVVDDLHFADLASAESIGRLAAVEGGPAWILAARPAESSPAMRAAADALEEGGRARRITLRPLDTLQIAELVDSLDVPGWRGAALAPRLAAHTGGNPLFVLETLKALRVEPEAAGGGPRPLPAAPDLVQLVARRLARLSTDALKLARFAAVAGQDFNSEMATDLLGARPLDLADAWAELEAAQVLRDQAFAHDLIHEAALSSVPPALARQLHGQIAGYLGERGGAPPRVASHWLASGSPLRAAPHLVEAGLQASRALRRGEAAAALHQAADLLERDARPGEAFEALDRFFEGTQLVWDETCRTLVERMEALADTPARRATAGAYRADLLARAGDFAGSGQAAREALRLLDPATAPVLAADLMQYAAGAQIQGGDIDGAVQTIARAVVVAESSGDATCIGNMAASLGAALDFAGRLAEAETHHARALELRKRAALAQPQIVSAVNYAGNRVEVGRLGDARALLELAARVGASHGLEVEEEWPATSVHWARVMLGVGDYTEAVHRYERARDVIERRMPHWSIAVHSQMTTLWMRLGQWARAHQASRAALALADGALPLYVGRARQLAAEVDAGMGHGEGQLVTLDETLAQLGGGGPRLARQIALARSQLVAPDEGLALALQVAADMRASGAAGLVLDAEVRASQAARRGGRADEAAKLARRALASLGEVEPYTLYRGEVWLAAVQALQEVHDPAAAEVLDVAVHWIRETAARRVPAEFRDSFLQRNPINRELLALAARARR